MKVTRKLVLALVALVVLILVFDAAVQVRREVRLFDDDLRRDTRVVSEVLAPAVARIWRNEGEGAALRFIEELDNGTRHMRLRWVPPDTAVAPLSARRADAEVSWAPVLTPDGSSGAIEVSEGLSEERAYVRTSMRNAAVTTLVIICLCAMAASVLGTVFVGRPTRWLVAKARRVGAGDLTPEAALPQRDELGELSAEMNAMCGQLADAAERVRAETAARLHAMEQLRHADRLMTVGKLASGIAHELGTPLNIVDGRAQMIAGGELETEEMVRENARIIAGQAQRMARIIRQLLDFARHGGSQRAATDVRALVGTTIEMLAPAAQKRSVHLRLTPVTEPVIAHVNESELAQVVTNIVVNALHATGREGEVSVELSSGALAPPVDAGASFGVYACIAVRDTGSGMDAGTLEHIFEPFFTTKGVGEGTGLGLSVAYGIVRDHGGWIAVDSQPGAGSTFRVYLPASAGG